VKDQILQTLRDLRKYALGKGYEIALFFNEEDSFLMRFANSAISLNTNEHLIRLSITAFSGRKRAGYGLITSLDNLEMMKQGIDTAAELVEHAQPLSYQPTVPEFKESFTDEGGHDPALAGISNEERLKYFNTAVEGLETDEIRLSGIFSNGSTTIAQISTRSEHTQYYRLSDAQITIVLAHAGLKWEVIAEQSAQKKSELDPASLRHELAFLLDHYKNDKPLKLPLGNYNIVLGPAATGELLFYMDIIGFSGGMLKRGYSFLSEEKIGQKSFSKEFTLVDDTERLETFPLKRDHMGISRKSFTIVQKGVFKKFTWNQDDADEFDAKATGHTVGHKSLFLNGGAQQVGTLQELLKLPRDADVLYIPYLHYMNIVNPSKGVITGSSRFGALLLKKDGPVMVPYNVRLTQSLLDIFGDRVAWLSSSTVPYNLSRSYGARNPAAYIVPRFIRVDGLEISHSNTSY